MAFFNMDAQNLQFSQVISSSVNQDSELIVPTGKVWKIEYATVYGSNAGYSQVRINNNQITGCFTCSYKEHFPIWVKSNDVISFIGSNGYISAIEFTIVP